MNLCDVLGFSNGFNRCGGGGPPVRGKIRVYLAATLGPHHQGSEII